ncbi:hypothetical protein [Deefgea piscis]|uniref:hypothetical protein n=1 Tax=Deefgea piscis TaxID=2739061 RepID=UPI001C805014|nr:hypothetical protein [Deefgea piscis]QZA82813.1 hypothetical protein K4H25_11860 [Deefgea piscis]
MADLQETGQWESGIYQWETSDPVEGGPSGIDNVPTRQLANRTAYLKKHVDELENGMVAAGKANKLSIARSIAMIGDASFSVNFDGSANVSATLTLANTGVAAGTYPKVTVDAKGRVTGGASLAATDIPALDWAKITTGKPTTVAGYGITDIAATVPNASETVQGKVELATNAETVAGASTSLAVHPAGVAAAIAALVASSPAALDTLNELAAALGNDPNFATTMTNALAQKAGLASPALTGSPTTPTPALGDNDGSIANTQFVQSTVNGKVVKSVAGGATVTLTAAEAGVAILEFTGALTANIAVVVPTGSGKWTIANKTTGAFTLTVKTAAGSGVVVTQDRTWSLYCDGTNVVDALTDFQDVNLTGVPRAPNAARSINSTQIANMAAIATAVGTDGGFSFRNLLINAAGTINQRFYVSGSPTTTANQYTLDRWRVVVAGQSLSWAASGAVNVMTAPAGGVEQVIEGANIIGGTYVLNWTGTATATVAGTAIAKGASFTLSANSNAVVRFTGGTFSMPQIEQGAVATAFEMRPADVELARCQRYFETSFVFGPIQSNKGASTCVGTFSQSAAPNGVQGGIRIIFKAIKRTIPGVVLYSPGAAGAQVWNQAAAQSCTNTSVQSQQIDGLSLLSTMTASSLVGNTLQIEWTADAEL